MRVPPRLWSLPGSPQCRDDRASPTRDSPVRSLASPPPALDLADQLRGQVAGAVTGDAALSRARAEAV